MTPRGALAAYAPVIVAGLVLGTASLARADTGEIVVGSKRFTESYLLGEAAFRAAGGDGHARRALGLGGTAIVFRALESGDVDLYPEYTGTLAEAVLHIEGRATIESVRAALLPRGLCTTASLGFENTYALAVRATDEKTSAVKGITDLTTHPELVIGLSNELLGRADGWPGLSQRYALPQTPKAMDHGLAYDAVKSGAIDVVEVYSTDAKIERFGLRVLDDDKHFFPPYEAVYVYRCELKTRAPDALAKIEKLEGSFDAATMIRLNALVEIDGRSPEEVVAAGSAPITAPRASFVQRLLAVVIKEGPTHLGMVVLSLLASIVMGVPLGILSERVRRARGAILGTVSVIQTIPSLALLCFLIPVLGIGTAPTIVALFLYGLLPIVQNTHQGILAIPASLRESATVLGLTRWERLFEVELPLASRAIVAGIRTSAIIGVGTATVAAFVGAGGFGQPISTGLNLNDTQTILLGAIPAAVLALMVGAVFAAIDRALARRHGS